MKQFWAIVCVIGFTAFWTYGFVALSGVFGDRPAQLVDFVVCFAGLGMGSVGWFQVMRYAPKMHGRRAAARARLDEEFSESMS